MAMKFKVAFWKRLWMAITGKTLYVYWSHSSQQIKTTFRFEHDNWIAKMTGGFSLPAKPVKVVYNPDPDYQRMEKFMKAMKLVKF